MAKERERKYLVADLPAAFQAARDVPRLHIVQGYLVIGIVTTRVRVVDNDRALLTLKGPSMGIERDEYEYEIPLLDGREMLDKYCAGRILTKTRYLVPHGTHVVELDEFHGRLRGGYLAEIEFKGVETVAPPAWCGLDVSDDHNYSNVALTVRGWPTEASSS